jgi:hypothetical protein
MINSKQSPDISLSKYEIFLSTVEELRISGRKLPTPLYIYLGAVLQSLAGAIDNNCSAGELLIPSDKIHSEADKNLTINLINQILADETPLKISLSLIGEKELDWISFFWKEGDVNLQWLPGKSLQHESSEEVTPDDRSRMFCVRYSSTEDSPCLPSTLQSVADRLKQLHRASEGESVKKLGALVSAEYKRRNLGQKPQKINAENAGLKVAVNVYSLEDCEWIDRMLSEACPPNFSGEFANASIELVKSLGNLLDLDNGSISKEAIDSFKLIDKYERMRTICRNMGLID